MTSLDAQPAEPQSSGYAALTPGERIERLALLCKQLAELRRAGAAAR